jgi:hypothetical protein
VGQFKFGDIDWHQGMDFITPALDFTGIPPSLGLSREDNLKNFPLNITAWFAIDDATEESGTLMFAPGTHRLGPVRYVPVEAGAGFHGIGLKFDWEKHIDVDAVITVPVPSGSCLLFNNLVFHKSMPNRSGRRRLGFAARYVNTSTQVYAHGDPAGFDLTNWGCVQVSGVRRPVGNKYLNPAAASLPPVSSTDSPTRAMS